MDNLNLPPFDTKLKKIDNRIHIYDRLRKKYIFLTPEEWVRQHFIHYLISHKNYPCGLIANETQITVHNCTRRCDSVIYNHELKPIAIVEYKSPDVKITQGVFDQIIRYNFTLKVKYLIISNGMQHFCCELDYESQSYKYLSEIPSFQDL